MDQVKALVVEEPGKLKLRKFPRPAIGEDDALLKVVQTGICASDPHFFHGKVERRRNFPLILGHEMVGTIDEIGKTASERWGVSRGDTVIVETSFGCGHCEMCLTGMQRLCKSSLGYGCKISSSVPPFLWGSYSEFMYLHPNAIVHKISDIEPEVALLICSVISNGIRWVESIGGVSIGDVVVIEGVGAQGLVSIAAAKEAGADTVIATGLSRDAYRFEIAKKMGADFVINVEENDAVKMVREITDGKMADVVVDVTGAASATELSIDLARPMGTVVLAGINGGKSINIVSDEITWKELKVLGAYSYDYQSVKKAIKLAQAKKYPFEEIVTHKFGFEDVEKALKMAAGEIEVSNFIKGSLIPK
ncbi:MAG: zinc-binding dehydrogenase [Bacillota bacterium]